MAFEYTEPIQNVAPGGSIRFYKGLGLDRNYDNTLYFDTQSEQTAFFAEKASNEITYSTGSTDNPTMIIKSPFIRTFMIPANSAELFDYDYIQVITNTNDESRPAMTKPLYMFITGVDFINQNVAIITCELDVIQTFMFDWDLGTQAVAQMHSKEIYNPFAEELKTPESFTVVKSETYSTQKFLPEETTSNGYLIEATQIPFTISAIESKLDPDWIGWSVSAAQEYAIPLNERNGDQLVYMYVDGNYATDKTVEQVLGIAVSAFDKSNVMNAIRSVTACPRILSGKHMLSNVGGTGEPDEALGIEWIQPSALKAGGKPDFTKYFDGGYLVGTTPTIMAPRYVRSKIEVPMTLLGYAPMDNKTFNAIECVITNNSGGAIMITPNDIENDYFYLTMVGVPGSNPSIYVYPSLTSITADQYQPGFDNADQEPRTYDVPILEMNGFPSYTVFNTDQVEAFALQKFTQLFGSFARIGSSMITGGMV